jgi:hypothetical protein
MYDYSYELDIPSSVIHSDQCIPDRSIEIDVQLHHQLKQLKLKQSLQTC